MRFLFLLLLVFGTANAHHAIIENHYYYDETPAQEVTEVTEITRITEGISDSDLAEAISMSAAVNHQFDFSYSGWQGSVNAAFYESTDAVSFGAANRFDWLDGALLHGSFTRNGNKDLWTVGGTWRF